MKIESILCVLLFVYILNMATEKSVTHPPAWRDGKSYEIYRKELALWEFGCEGVLDKKKRGPKVVLGMPDSDDLGIKTNILENLSIGDIEADDGVKKITDYLDKLLGKDELDDMLQKMEDFDNYSKSPDENVNVYIMNFDQKYSRIKADFTLPEKYRAFRLLGRANLTNEERVLVIAPLNYNSQSLFAEMKASLKKVLGGGCSGGAYVGGAGGVGASGTPAIKIEPTFYNNNQRGRGNRGQYRDNRGYGRGDYGRGDNKGYGRGRGYGYANKDSRKEQELNPVLQDGSRMKCFWCGSVEHLFAKCRNMKYVNQVDEVDTGPDTGPVDESEVYYTHSTPWYSIDRVIGSQCNEETVVLFTGNLVVDNCLLNKEASTCAVIDSDCTSNVCGSSWMNSYISCLTEEQKKSVVSKPSNRLFRFGGEALYKSVGMCTIPAKLANKYIFVQCDVVESEVPLLLSRKTLKKMKAVINFENDTACILGERINLSITSSGHHCVNILPENGPNHVYAVVLQDLDNASLFKALQKIHCQFGHPPMKQRLVTLLKDAGAWKDRYMEVLNRIYSECEICHVYARTPSRPVVALSMAREFNQVVAMDLKYWKKGLWIFHLVDVFSRYTMSDFITRKKPEEVINVIMSCWIAVFWRYEINNVR